MSKHLLFAIILSAFCTVTIAQPPENTEPCTAHPLEIGTEWCQDASGAGQYNSPLYDICLNTQGADLWYQFDVDVQTQQYTVDFNNESNDYPASILLWKEGEDCDSPHELISDDSYCNLLGDHSFTYSCLEVGRYFIMVSYHEFATGSFCLELEESTPPTQCADNSHCNNPEAIIAPSPDSPAICVSGCNIGACPEDIDILQCNYSGGVVWYAVTTPSDITHLNLTVNGFGDDPLEYPQVHIFNQSCGESPIMPCQTGIDGTVSISGLSVIPNKTYYVAVANYYGLPGEFELCISTNYQTSICKTGDELIPDLEGPYCPGQMVTFTYEFEFTSIGNGIQWPHAIIPKFGKGWDLAASYIELQDMPGNWYWIEQGVVTYNSYNEQIMLANDLDNTSYLCHANLDPDCFGQPLASQMPMPAGWYWINQPGQCGTDNLEDPNYTWGMPCNGVCTATLTFNLVTRSDVDCSMNPSELSCDISVFVMSDFQTGCWLTGGSGTCNADTPLYFSSSINCTEEDVEMLSFEANVCSSEPMDIQFQSNSEMTVFKDYVWATNLPDGVQGKANGKGKFLRESLRNTTSQTQMITYNVQANTHSSCYEQTGVDCLVEVLPEMELELSVDLQHESCFNPCSGRIDIKPQSNQEFLHYNWGHTEQDTSVLDGLCPGIYKVTITDELGCELWLDYQIEAAEPYTADLEYNDISCLDSIACASLEISEGMEHFDINWSTGDIGALEICGLDPGSYYVELLDTTECAIRFDFEVEQSPDISYEYSVVPERCNGDCDGIIRVEAQGNGDIIYMWEDTSLDGTELRNLCAGNYQLTISDEEGCSKALSIDITDGVAYPEVDIDVSSYNVTLNKPTIEINNSTYPLTSSFWDFGDGNTSSQKSPSHTYIDTGVYVVKYLAGHGECFSQDSFTIVVKESTVSTQSTFELLQTISLSPNPTKNNLIIHWPKQLDGQDFELHLLDMQGRVIQSVAKQRIIGEASQITLNSIPSGIYTIRVILDNGTTSKQLVIN